MFAIERPLRPSSEHPLKPLPNMLYAVVKWNVFIHIVFGCKCNTDVISWSAAEHTTGVLVVVGGGGGLAWGGPVCVVNGRGAGGGHPKSPLAASK